MIAFFMAYTPLRDLLRSAEQTHLYSHMILIPWISAYLIYLKRKTLFSHPEYSYGPGIALMMAGATIYLLGMAQGARLNPNDYAAVMALSALLCWVGSFVLLYGITAFRKTPFPFLFLVFMIPVPSFLMEKIIFLLLSGSSHATHLLFQITGTPFSHQGFEFDLPGLCIEIAPACSGIRSSIALLITTVLAAHLFLRTTGKKAILILSVVPIAMFKNAVRIVTISLLSIYVDERIITGGFLHRSGGFIFFGIALFILAVILLTLRRFDRASSVSLESG